MRSTSPLRSRRAFTVVEVLVLVAVVGTLAAILVPTVQNARETARRIECVEHLGRIGRVIHAHIQSNGAAPPAIINSIDSPYTPAGQALSTTGWTALTRHLGETYINDEVYEFDVGMLPGTFAFSADNHSRSMANQRITGARMPIFTCPSDRVPSLANHAESPGGCVHAMKSNYLFAAGANVVSHLDERDAQDEPRVCNNEAGPMYRALLEAGSLSLGVFGHNHSATLRQITDGLSNTIMVGESLQDHAGGDRTAVVWGQGKLYGQMAVLDGLGVATAHNAKPRPSKTTINYAESKGGLPNPAVLSSRHGKGVNVLLADGAVRFLEENMDVNVYTALFTIRDVGELGGGAGDRIAD